MTAQFFETFADSITGKVDTGLFRNTRVILPSRQFPPVSPCLFGDISDEFVVIQPLPINIERDDESYVVSDDVFLVYGDGDTNLEAIKDYTNSLIEFYSLVEQGAENNPFDKKTLLQLKTYIQPKK